MDKKRISLIAGILIIVAVAIWASGYGSVPPKAASGKLSVVASFYPLYYLAGEIGGDKAEAVNLTPAGAEPHDYEPTAKDIARMQSADILILNGYRLEPWAESMTKDVDPSLTKIVMASEGIASEADPHAWLSPILAQRMAQRITAAFAQKDPANAPYYADNLTRLLSKLASLDAEYKAGLSSCASRDIVTSHAAFGYLASAYGLRQVPIAGISPDAEPSAQELAAIAEFAKANKVKYIFFESLASPKLAEALAKEVGAKSLVLDPIEGIPEEELAQGKTYLTQMETNLTNLKTALSCTE